MLYIKFYEFEVDGSVLEARIYSTAIKEVTKKLTEAKSNMLYQSEEIFNNVRYLYSTPDYEGNPDIYRWNYFYTPVQIGDDVVGVRVAVRDRIRSNESQIYHWGIKSDRPLAVPGSGNNSGPIISSSGRSDNSVPQDSRIFNPSAEENSADTEIDRAGKPARTERKDEVTNGTGRTQSMYDDGGRDAGLDPGVEGRGVEAGGPQRAADAGGKGSRAADRRADLRAERINDRIARFGGLTQDTTAAELIDSGDPESYLAIVPKNLYEEGMRRAAADAESMGASVTYVTGMLRVRGTDGEYHSADAVYDPQRRSIIAKADSVAFEGEQLVDHEVFHHLVRETPALVQQLADEIRQSFSEEEFNAIVERYMQVYRGATGGDLQKVQEEVLADAYAGMNRFRNFDATKYTDTVRGMTGQTDRSAIGRENAAAITRRGVGDDGKFSIRNTRSIPWEEQVRGYFRKDGSVKSSDSLYLGESRVEGVENAPLYIPTSVITKAIREPKGSRSAHGLQRADILSLKDEIKDAPLVITNPERNALVYVTDHRTNSGYLVAAFDLNNDLFGENAHRATSLHGRESIVPLLEHLNADATVYVKNEGRINQMLPGNQILKSLKLLAKVETAYGESIAENGRDVKAGDIKFSYAGERAKTADVQALRDAQAMETIGADMESIRRATGWHKGRDGKWRFEIDDSGMRVDRSGERRGIDRNTAMREYNRSWNALTSRDMTEQQRSDLGRYIKEANSGSFDETLYRQLANELGSAFEDYAAALEAKKESRDYSAGKTLQDYIQHDELFEAYPALKYASLQFKELPQGEKGYYSYSDGIVLNEALRNAPESTLIHEIQHVIQRLEGFSGGSSPEYWARKDYENGTSISERLQKRYDDLLNGLSREEQNRYIRYMELERELGRLFLADENSEDGRKYARLETEQDKLYEELWPNEWFRKLLDLDREIGNPSEEYYRLYRNSAGEIEARDSENRRALTAEQRRETAPDYGNEDTVFAEGSESYSIVEPFTDENGKQYENAVLLDTDFFDGISPRNWGRKLKQYVENRAETSPFIMTVQDENGNSQTVQFARMQDRVKKGGNVHPALTELYETSDNISKLAVIHVDEIAEISAESNPYYTGESSHGWLDEQGWLHRNANVINARNGAIYNITLDIAKTRDGRTILYATKGKIKKVGDAQVHSLKIRGAEQNSNSKASIYQGTEKSQGKISTGEETAPDFSLAKSEDTEELTAANNLSEADLREALISGAITLSDESDTGSISIVYPKGAEHPDGTVAVSDIQKVILPNYSALGIFRDLEDMGIPNEYYGTDGEYSREQLVNRALGREDRQTASEARQAAARRFDQERIDSLMHDAEQAEERRTAAERKAEETRQKKIESMKNSTDAMRQRVGEALERYMTARRREDTEEYGFNKPLRSANTTLSPKEAIECLEAATGSPWVIKRRRDGTWKAVQQEGLAIGITMPREEALSRLENAKRGALSNPAL